MRNTASMKQVDCVPCSNPLVREISCLRTTNAGVSKQDYSRSVASSIALAHGSLNIRCGKCAQHFVHIAKALRSKCSMALPGAVEGAEASSMERNIKRRVATSSTRRTYERTFGGRAQQKDCFRENQPNYPTTYCYHSRKSNTGKQKRS